MITTIDDALQFYENREREFEAFGSSILKIRSSPLTGLNNVVQNLGLPKDYAECADRFLMENVSLGYFELCPANKNSLCSSLERLNGQERNSKLPTDLLHVAAFEADVIVVSKGEPYHEDRKVYFVDITTSPDVKIKPIADRFESFIVLASALDQAVLEENCDPETMIVDLATVLLPQDYVAPWKEIVSMVI